MTGERDPSDNSSRPLAERSAHYSASHQIRDRSLRLFVSRTPSSASSESRAWTHRRDSGTSSETARALTAGPSLSRMIRNNSSSVTVRGRPASPIEEIHPTRVINRPDTTRQTNDRYKSETYIGCNWAGQPPQGVFGAPARYHRAGLASQTLRAMHTTAPQGLESNEPRDQHEQSSFDHFGFIRASQLSDDLTHNADASQEASR